MDVSFSSFYLTIQPFPIQRNTTLPFVKCTYVLRTNCRFIQQITLSFCFATMSRNIIHYLLCLCLCQFNYECTLVFISCFHNFLMLPSFSLTQLLNHFIQSGFILPAIPFITSLLLQWVPG